MSLRKKTLLIISLTLLGTLALLYATSYLIWLRGYEDLEDDRLRNNVRRAHNILLEERRVLEHTVTDNAQWDETYAFMQKRKRDFAQSNFPDETLELLNLNYLALVDTSGAAALSLGYDYATHQPIPFYPSLLKYLSKDSALVRLPLRGRKFSGLLRLPESHLLFAVCPILTSKSQGPVRGVMFIARFWGKPQSDRISTLTQTVSQLKPTDTDATTPLLADSTWSITDDMITLQATASDSLTGSILLPDIYGKPTLALQVRLRRSIYEQGMASIIYFMSALSLCGILLGLAMMLLLEKTLLSRFAKLDAELGHIGAIQDPALRVTTTGKDEVTHLAVTINKMLAALQEVNEKLVSENQERERAETELKRSEAELRNLSTHLEKLREDERAHIAREIHDELGQTLSSLRMDLRTLENQLPPDKRELREITHSMSEVIYLTLQRVKRISQELRPSVLEHLNFNDAVAWQTQAFTSKYGIPCELILENADALKLKREVASELFRVLQEALTNIVRHAAATHVHVRLQKTSTQLVLSIQDNGKGLAASEKKVAPTFGLLGMRERLHRLKGTLEVISKPGSGTTIVAATPLTNLESL